MASNEGSAGLLLGGNQDFSTEFYLTQFKITPCTATYPHNWSLCPFVHPNEKARRRDPRIYNYQPVPCPDDRKGVNCPRKDNCQFTHNVYEYWMHPKQFRTQLCHLGTACTRPICFFAHRVSEIRYPDREEGGSSVSLGGTAQQQQQQQPYMQQPGAGSQAVQLGAAVRPAVGQFDQAAALQQQMLQQGQQQVQQQAQQQAQQQQLQQMTMQLQQLQIAQVPQAAGAAGALLPGAAGAATPVAQQQPYMVVTGGQFQGGQLGGFSAGTSSQGAGAALPQSAATGSLAAAAGSSYQAPGQGFAQGVGSAQSYQQQQQQQYQTQFPQVAPTLQQPYHVTPYGQQQYAPPLHMQQPYPQPPYQQ